MVIITVTVADRKRAPFPWALPLALPAAVARGANASTIQNRKHAVTEAKTLHRPVSIVFDTKARPGASGDQAVSRIQEAVSRIQGDTRNLYLVTVPTKQSLSPSASMSQQSGTAQLPR